MPTLITFALIHNTLLTISYFLLIGIYRNRKWQTSPWTNGAESTWIILTALLVGKFYEVLAVPLLIYVLMLLSVNPVSKLFFPAWTEVHRKFYTFLLSTEVLYLLYKLTFLGTALLTMQDVPIMPWGETGINLFGSFIIGQLFFIVLMVSETFVLVCSAYAIYDGLSVMADQKQAANPIKFREEEVINTCWLKVSLHVPVCREPPGMVIETLSALARLDYPDFEVIVVSNNTRDPALWHPVEQTCRQLGFKFLHFDTLPGHKAGALNRALAETSESAELISVIDSDYVVKPGFLKRVVPLFQDSSIAFVQTSQDYRNREGSLFLKTCYPVYKLFFDVVMIARNRRNSIMFAGTMGILRKSVLSEVNGWNEQCVAEDAEASLRILSRGHKGTFIHESWGYGLMPPDFSGCEKQWSRWMIGGIQLVRINWKILFSPFSDLTFAQRWDYTVGGILSFGAFLTMTSVLFLAGIALAMTIDPARIPAIFASLSTSLSIFAFFITLTAMMVVLIFKWNMNYSSRRSLGAFLFMMGLSWCRANAVWLALTRRKLSFERTSKFPVSTSLARALWNTRHQIVMAILVVVLNLVIILNYDTHSPGVMIISVWQEITYLSSITLSLLSASDWR